MASSSPWRALGGKYRALMSASQGLYFRRCFHFHNHHNVRRSSKHLFKVVYFLGVREVSRTEAVKKVWEYIKLQNLQDPANKKVIRCDMKLKTIFDGKDTVGFLEIARLPSSAFYAGILLELVGVVTYVAVTWKGNATSPVGLFQFLNSLAWQRILEVGQPTHGQT
ncbi:hypothetical protein Ancab_015885 [Ancistrocladus abbreviatus]